MELRFFCFHGRYVSGQPCQLTQYQLSMYVLVLYISFCIIYEATELNYIKSYIYGPLTLSVLDTKYMARSVNVASWQMPTWSQEPKPHTHADKNTGVGRHQ